MLTGSLAAEASNRPKPLKIPIYPFDSSIPSPFSCLLVLSCQPQVSIPTLALVFCAPHSLILPTRSLHLLLAKSSRRCATDRSTFFKLQVPRTVITNDSPRFPLRLDGIDPHALLRLVRHLRDHGRARDCVSGERVAGRDMPETLMIRYYDLTNELCGDTAAGDPFPADWALGINGGYPYCQGQSAKTLNDLGTNRIVGESSGRRLTSLPCDFRRANVGNADGAAINQNLVWGDPAEYCGKECVDRSEGPLPGSASVG